MTKKACGGSTILSLDHCVLATGFGRNETSGTDFWWVRNSWGTSFGLEGYLMVERGVNACGISDEVTCATVAQ